MRAVDAEPIQDTFVDLHGLFLELAACDTSPTPRPTCSALRDELRSPGRLALFVALARSYEDDEADQSIPPELRAVIERLQTRVEELGSTLSDVG